MSMVERLESLNKTRLVAILGAFLLAGILASSITTYYISKGNIRELILTRELPLASDTIYSEIQRILLPPLNVAETMANSVFLRDWVLNGEQDVNKITDYLNKIQDKQGMSSAFLASDKTLNYYSYQGVRSRIDPSGVDDWYAHCRDNAADFEINADIDMHVSNRLTLFINYKVFDYEGRFIGITGVAMRIESIEALVRKFKEKYHKTIYFVTPGGQVAFRVEEDGDPLEKPDFSNYLGSETLADELLSRSASTLEYERDGEPVLLNARYLPELQWYLMVEETANENVAYVRRILVINLTASILITLLVLAIVYQTVQQYQKRLILQNGTVSEQARTLEGQNTELEKLHREKDEFMKLVVHDLKTPLSGMVGMARLCQSEADSAQIREFSAKIEETGVEMAELIQTLLDLKSIESAVSPELEPVKVDQVLESGMEVWEAPARHKAIRIRQDYGETPVWVYANKSWLQTIVGNLVSNAVKYSPEGSDVILRVEADEQNVRVSVIDHGPGILPEEQPRLFRQFSRLSSRPTAGESSNGLGLYIARMMVEKLGGRIGVNSEPGSGSCFWVEFPRARDDGA